MKKILIKICAGTHCYVMGGSELLNLSDHLTEDIQDNVEIKAVTCFSYCNDETSTLRPPLVEVNGKIIEKASIPAIIKSIYKELGS